jgi:hypothetical protein
VGSREDGKNEREDTKYRQVPMIVAVRATEKLGSSS